MRETRRIRVVFIAVALLCAADADARPISLAWDSNPEPSVAGYIVYFGSQPGTVAEYEGAVDVGNLLSVQLDLPGDQYYFAVRAYDTNGNLSPFSFEVGDTPSVTLLNPGDQVSAAGEVISLPIFATGDVTSYVAAGLPPELDIDPATGFISGLLAPTPETTRWYLVTVSVFDRAGNVSSVPFKWTVRTNHAPTVRIPPTQSTVLGATVDWSLVAWDDDGDPVTFSVVGLPPGLTLDSTTGAISGRILAIAPTIYNVAVNVSDGVLVTPVQFAWVLAAAGGFGVDQIVYADSATSMVTTEAFTTSAAGETLIAFVTSDQWPVDLEGQTATVTGGDLEWTLVTRANAVYGSAEIWKATAPASVTDLQVTAAMSIGEAAMSMTVMSFVGSAGVGAFAAASADTGPPTVTLTTTAANSLVFAAGNDWDGGVERTPGDNQSIVHQVVSPDPGNTLWVQNYLLPIGAPGTVVEMSDVAPTDHRWNFAAVEIVPLAVESEHVFTIDDVSVGEGRHGTTSATFTVSLLPPSTEDAAVHFATASRSARAFRDYLPAFGTLKFPAGTTTRTITVKVIGDSYIEPDETFVVNLWGAKGAKIRDHQGIGTIVNDDFPAVSIGNTSVIEGDSGTTRAVFPVELSRPSRLETTVDFSTGDDTAAAGSDYLPRAGTLTFPPGTTRRTITVSVIGDSDVEPDERFVVELFNAKNAVIDDGRARGTIVNDDFAALSIGNVTVPEGHAGTTNAVFTVTLSSAVSHKVTVRYSTSNGSAASGSDYSTISGTLTFMPGVTTQTIAVPVIGDRLVEGNETFYVNLSNATNARIKVSQGVATIGNDDVAPPEGRIYGFGRIDEGRTHHHLVFRVTERNSREYGSLEYWAIDGRNCGGDDDDDRRSGADDRDYGRDHRNPIRWFAATAVSAVTFSDDPAFKPGSGRREPSMDSVVFTGTGRWNGKSGYTFEVRATDQGEPGRQRDTFSLVVKDSRGTVVATVNDTLDGGNIQSTRFTKHW